MEPDMKEFRKWIPVVLVVSGWSYFTEFLMGWTKNAQDIERGWKTCIRWLDPRMLEHWNRAIHPTDEQKEDSWYHRFKNVPSERARLDPQVTAKGQGFYFGIAIIEFVLILALLAVLGGILYA